MVTRTGAGGARARRVGCARRAAVRDWAAAACASLDAHRAEIDLLNVFPVHDSDTGTNLATTMRAAVDALDDDARPLTTASARCSALARGAVLGARGNSGNIVAQLLRGLADAAAEAGGVRRAARCARGCAAARPRPAPRSPTRSRARSSPSPRPRPRPSRRRGQLRPRSPAIALAAADEALGRTPEQLPALARAGVVDAGGQGFVLILEALVRSIGAETVADRRRCPRRRSPCRTSTTPGGGAFEVQYLLDIAADVDCRQRCATPAARRAGAARRLGGRGRHRRRHAVDPRPHRRRRRRGRGRHRVRPAAPDLGRRRWSPHRTAARPSRARSSR